MPGQETLGKPAMRRAPCVARRTEDPLAVWNPPKAGFRRLSCPGIHAGGLECAMNPVQKSFI
jgi:hypothetical protein